MQPVLPEKRPNLLGCCREQLRTFCQNLAQPAYRGDQLFDVLFRQRRAPDSATNLPRSFIHQLAQTYVCTLPHLDTVQIAQDGTRKYRFVSAGHRVFESVYIPQVARGAKTNTLCVSSQTGCAVGCRFCFTASLRRNVDLTPDEIVGQVMAVQDELQKAPQNDSSGPVRNIVFMGMGEPLLNYDNVVRAIAILSDPAGLGFSPRRITVSTAGVVPRIHDLGRDLRVQLAISLNAASDDVRSAIMPINKKWPLSTLVEAMRAYPLPKGRRITVEYVLLAGVNDRPEDAQRLPKLLAGIPVKLNLLPLNAHDRTPYVPPSHARVLDFQATLRRAGLNALVRTPRGPDISAACGQLGETVHTSSP